jgi:hypothetical protein
LAHFAAREPDPKVRHYGEMYEHPKEGALLDKTVPKSFARAWHAAASDSFASATPEN